MKERRAVPGRTGHMTLDGLFLVLMFLLFSGCAVLMPPPVPEYAKRYQEAQALFDHGLYQEARRSFQAIADGHPPAPWEQRSRFSAAYALVYHNNPDKDYPHAEKEFSDIALQYAGDPIGVEAATWADVLKRLDLKRIQELNADLETLGRKINGLTQELQEARIRVETLDRARSVLSAERSALETNVNSLLREKTSLLEEKTTVEKERDRLALDKAVLEKESTELKRDIDVLLKAKTKLEKNLHDLRMVDIKLEKQRKHVQKEEGKE